jgi:serine/threonine-protein kinase
MGEDEDRRLGQILAGRYKVVELISSGGMGAVYRGERLELGRQVAIKFLHGLFRTDKAFRGRFDREAKAMSRLSHPFCVSVIDFGVDDVPYIVMDFVVGRTLRELLREGPLDTERALRIGGQILTGLAHAHGRGIIHRDIKPENIMLSEATGLGEHVRIFDFGLAKLHDGTMDADFSTAAAVIGTPSYMSPEQSFGETVDITTDFYSTGVVLFEMLTGRKPFQAEDATDVIRMHRIEKPPQLADVAPDLKWSPNLESVVARALNKKRELRYQSADEFAKILAGVPEAPEQTGMVPTPPADEPEATTVLQPPSESLLDRLRLKLSRRAWFGIGGAVLGVVVVVSALAIGLATWEKKPDKEAVDAGVEPVVVAEPEKAPPEPKPEPTPGPDVAKDTGAPEAEVDPEVKIVQQMIALGQQKQAIATLRELRQTDPDNADYAYLLGNLFFDKSWHSAGVDRYAQALDLDPAYREDERLIRDLIDALSGTKLQKQVRPLLVEKIGERALPYLREAAENHENLKVRLRAAAIAGEISG